MELKRIGIDQKEEIKKLFVSVFTIEPWNDDWSDESQLDSYIEDLIGQGYSLTYGLYDGDELCIRTDRRNICIHFYLQLYT